MSYQSALSYLDSLQSTKIELGLERMNAACEALKHPERKFQSVVIAGTNGKGSTAAFLESILRHHGLKVGLYTSPHLIDVRERIQINREMISEEEFAKTAEQVRCHCERPSVARQSPASNLIAGDCFVAKAPRNDIQLTYFEFLTAMAFQYFAEQKVDMAVLEVGLGGRLDSTNVVTPGVSVITRIGLDHQGYLGDTIEKITFEKCGIIKEGVPVVTVDQDVKVMDVIRRVADEKKTMLHVVSPFDVRYKLGLLGEHQLENAACAMKAAELIRGTMDEGRGTKEALSSTRWPGRLEIVSEKPLVMLDGAHNPNGAEALAKFFEDRFAFRDARIEARSSFNETRFDSRASRDDTRIERRVTSIVILIGIMADKDIEGIIKPLVKIADEWVITRPSTPRAADTEMLSSVVSRQLSVEKPTADGRRPTTRIIEPIPLAIERTLQAMAPNSILVITGSLYTVGEARRYFI